MKANVNRCRTLRARHSCRLELKLENMDFTPKLLMRDIGEADATEIIPHAIRDLRTPRPWTLRSRQVSWLTDHHIRPHLPRTLGPSGAD